MLLSATSRVSRHWQEQGGVRLGGDWEERQRTLLAMVVPVKVLEKAVRDENGARWRE